MKNKDTNLTPEKKDSKLWDIFKFIVGIIFTLVIAYKLLISDIVFDFSKFDFNALLALLLSLFAIGLSVAFYFKATDTSNLFYDNIYKFTKDVSTILGEIKAGFGEKLQNLDKGYSGLLDRMDKGGWAQHNEDIEETKSEKNEVKQSLDTKIKERNEIIQNLLEKSHIEQKEKDKIKKSLEEKEKIIEEFEQELRRLQIRLREQEISKLSRDIDIPSRLLRFLIRRLHTSELNREDLNKDVVQEFISDIISEIKECKLPEELYVDLIENRIIHDNEKLTLKGYFLIRKIVKSEIN